MNIPLILSNADVYQMSVQLFHAVRHVWEKTGKDILNIYGVPRGGVPVAYLVAAHDPGLAVVDDPEDADVFVDDIIDSGTTCDRYTKKYDKPFFALVSKGDRWVVFPWERALDSVDTVGDNVRRLLQFVGEDPKRGGLIETPARVVKAWEHWCSGYKVDIPALFKVFEDGADGCDQMVAVGTIPFYSHCEHHMAPFFGTASIAYVPDKKILGLSKFARVLDAYALRLQVQERLTNQIANAINEHLKPKGVGVMIRARHMCMESRGVAKQGSDTTTCALRGVMLEGAARAEFLALARGG